MTNPEKHFAYTNELIHESSPYLLQHAHNPVNWYPWGNKALEKAKKEKKMLIISIGYAACHWCHVMEHESFEDTTVARIMNEHFVCIKVDREERPDVDQVYMNAAQLITGTGGWPLNALALPDGKPFYAGTYFPKENWIRVLEYFVKVQRDSPALLNEQADKVLEGIHASEFVPLKKEETILRLNDINNIFDKWKSNIDFERGGMNRAPKFPMPANWEFLLQYYYLTQNKDAFKAITATLDNMAMGGIYDQVGGGFSRYSTDADWHVPHFEKMLYDNAQLVSLYSHAYQLTKNPLYKKTVEHTLDFIAREMTSPEGGFYSSLDADSEGEEGKFYVWTKKEIDELLGKDAVVFEDYYDVTEAGNWEHGNNILLRKNDDEVVAKRHGISLETLNKIIDNGDAVLLKERSKRVRPALDDKILTSWNALMMKAYTQAYRAFGEKRFLNAALKNAAFLSEHAINDKNEITRNYKNGKSSIEGLLDDYAFVISGFIELYQATFDEQWLDKAKAITDYTITHFFDRSTGMFYYTHNEHSNLIARKMEISDNVIPASNSEMAKNLFVLSQYFDNEHYHKMAVQQLKNVKEDLTGSVGYYSNWASLALQLIHPPFEVAILGDNAIEKREEFDQHYLPDVLFMGGKKEGSLSLLEHKLIAGQTTIYVCSNKTCKQPVTEVAPALTEIKQRIEK